ncbi:serine protease [Roseovarius aestuarii]|nr:serine protease [Roseovarius aestuarii]
MPRLIRIIFFAFALALHPLSAHSQDYSKLLEGFDARALTQSDKRFLQTALAFEGHYKGLLDGDWGAKSRDAMRRFSWSEFQRSPEDWHMAVLGLSLLKRMGDNGWKIKYFDLLGMSFLFPADSLIVDAPTKNFLNWRHSKSTLSYSIGVHDRATAQNLHTYTIRQHAAVGDPYSVRKTNFAVSTSLGRDGVQMYTRSNFVNGHWSTVMLSAHKRDGDILGAVSSSIDTGYAPPITFTENGRLDDAIRLLIAALDDDDLPPEQGDGLSNSNKSNAPSGGSGSGFFVSTNGHVLTNEHVVSNCHVIKVNGRVAELVEVSEDFDLAILQTTFSSHQAVAEFSTRSAKLNSDITVVGYPYAGLLSGLNVTRGSVSSLKGLGGAVTQMQISAPVQAGNSGGPVLGANGEVVGVVVSKLDANIVSDVMGDVPQNVNFAIRSEIAKLFLSQNGVEPVLSASNTRLLPEALAEKADLFTAFIECEQ